MAVRHFDCDSCGAHGKISFKEGTYQTQDIAYCPFCGSDIYEAEDYEEDADDEQASKSTVFNVQNKKYKDFT